MSMRPIRYSVFAVLLLVGVAAAYQTWDLHNQTSHLLDRERTIDDRLDAMFALVTELGAAQQAYVAPGQPDTGWLDRAPALLQQLRDQVGGVRPWLDSAENDARLEKVLSGLESLSDIDQRARDYLRVSQELMAADLLFTEGRDALAAVVAYLLELRSSEQSRSVGEADALATRQAWVLGGGALIWLVGLFCLVSVPRVAASGDPETATRVPDEPAVSETSLPDQSPLDLEQAAGVCARLSQVTDAATLPVVLGEAARVLDATGLIVWLDSGEQLHAVSTHGYDAAVVARLGSISRTADNATAAAWRTAQLQVVPGDPMTNGAVVAPIVGPDGCRGVLTAELRHGREDEAAARAVTAMFAAQLAAILSVPAATAEPGLSAAPAASAPADPAAASPGADEHPATEAANTAAPTTADTAAPVEAEADSTDTEASPGAVASA